MNHDSKVMPTADQVAALACRDIPPAASGARYTPTGPTTYRLCATFRYPQQDKDMTWPHPAGHYCVDKRVDARD
jgi:hypothetical protein